MSDKKQKEEHVFTKREGDYYLSIVFNGFPQVGKMSFLIEILKGDIDNLDIQFKDRQIYENIDGAIEFGLAKLRYVAGYVEWHNKTPIPEWCPIKINKKIIQYDLNNNIVNEWNSGQEIKKRLNYNASAISECCRGIRKKYKNYIWEFK